MPNPMFTIIIPSRNRPDDFRRALDSILAQSSADVEVIAVIDGAKGDDEATYRALENDTGGPNVKFVFLPYRVNGHGPSHARNEGAAAASGQYLGFLDDDDLWTDTAHLSDAHSVIDGADDRVDLYLTLQEALHPDGRRDRNVWLAGLDETAKATLTPDQWGAYPVQLGDLLQAVGFCHLNTTIIRRALFLEIGAFDETLRYEEDRDMYFRAIDKAKHIRFKPAYVALHNVPENNLDASASTRIRDMSKYLFQLKLLNKKIIFSEHLILRKLAQREKGYTLKNIALDLSGQRKFREAALYAREALAVSFGFKWLAVTAFLTARAIFNFSGKNKRR